MRVPLERDNCRLVLFGSNHVFYERARGCLFIRQCALLRDAYVYQKRDRQRPIGFALKSKHFLRHAIFENANVAFLKSGDVTIVLVRRSEEKIREISFDAENVVLIGRSLLLREESKREDEKSSEN